MAHDENKCPTRHEINVPLYSTIDNVKLTSNKERQFTCPGDQVIFTCRVFGSSSLEWRNPLITQITSYIAIDTPPQILNRDPLTISLISVTGTPLNANFTSTLQVTASRMIMRDETTVMCLSTTANKTDNFTIAGKNCTTLVIMVTIYLVTAVVYGKTYHKHLFHWILCTNLSQKCTPRLCCLLGLQQCEVTYLRNTNFQFGIFGMISEVHCVYVCT